MDRLGLPCIGMSNHVLIYHREIKVIGRVLPGGLLIEFLWGVCGRFEEGFASYTEDCLPLCVVSLDRKSDRQFESGLAAGTHLASFCADIGAFRDTICSAHMHDTHWVVLKCSRVNWNEALSHCPTTR